MESVFISVHQNIYIYICLELSFKNGDIYMVLEASRIAN